MSNQETETRNICWIEIGIIKIQYKNNVEVDLKNAIEDYQVYDQFTQRKPVKKLVVSGQYTNITSEARVYIQQENKKRTKFIIGEAIVIHSLGQRMLANVYFKFVRVGYPVKIFSNEKEGLNWLEEIKSSEPMSVLN